MVTGIPATTIWKGARLALFRARTSWIVRRPERHRRGQREADKPAKDETAKEEPAAAPAGTIIGRTRLIGGHGQSPEGGGGQGATPTMNMGQPKTQYIHGAGIETDPVAGWVVVVKGPGRGNFSPVFVGMNSLGRDASQRVSLSFGDDCHLARGARLHHLR